MDRLLWELAKPAKVHNDSRRQLKSYATNEHYRLFGDAGRTCVPEDRRAPGVLALLRLERWGRGGFYKTFQKPPAPPWGGANPCKLL